MRRGKRREPKNTTLPSQGQTQSTRFIVGRRDTERWVRTVMYPFPQHNHHSLTHRYLVSFDNPRIRYHHPSRPTHCFSFQRITAPLLLHLLMPVFIRLEIDFERMCDWHNRYASLFKKSKPIACSFPRLVDRVHLDAVAIPWSDLH